jgi:cytochrome c-type biogenesis protein CcmH/NrfG
LALCLFRLQRFAAALPHFDAIVADQPGFAPAHAARGAILEQLDRFQEAEAAYRRAYQLQPDNLLAMSGLASTASRSGRNGEAREFAEKVLGGEPGYPDAVLVLARADLAQGCYADGESRLQALIADSCVPPGSVALAKTLLAEFDTAKSRKFDA